MQCPTYNLLFTYTSSFSLLLELWGSFKIWLINKADYYDHSEPLFLRSHITNFNDLLFLKVMQIIFKAKSKLLPNCVQRFFWLRESKYVLSDFCKLTVKKKKKKAKKEIKWRCISVVDADMCIKMCNSFAVCKQMFYKYIFERHMWEYCCCSVCWCYVVLVFLLGRCGTFKDRI